MEQQGIVGRFDSICFSRGEENALLLCNSTGEMEAEDVQEVMLNEVQLYSQYIAACLVRRHGIKRNDRVLLLCKGYAAAELVAIIACLRVGAVFVPVDTSCSIHHASRIVSIARQCKPVCSIIVSNDPERADEDPMLLLLAQKETNIHRYVVLTSDLSLPMPNDISIEHDLQGIHPTYQQHPQQQREKSPMYIMYTSGTTGAPKGVIGTEIGLINRIMWQYRNYPYTESDIVCRRTPLVFIDALAEMFAPLLNEECTILQWVPPCMAFQRVLHTAFNRAIRMGVTRFTLLPSQLALIIQSFSKDVTHSSSILIVVSGEPLYQHIADSFYKVFPLGSLVNLYGCTEMSGDVLHFLVPAPKTVIRKYEDENSLEHNKMYTVPIGEIIDGNEMYIDEVTNELYIAGLHVALGYYEDQPETDKRFLKMKVKDTDQLDKIWFKSGDIMERKDNGLLYWVGRVDNQVKVRGVRVEIDEATHVLQMVLDDFCMQLYPNMRHRYRSCMIAVDIENLNNDEKSPNVLKASKQLVAFIEVSNGKDVSGPLNELRSSGYLENHLPPILMPTLILQVDVLPETSSGKLDRNELINALTLHIRKVISSTHGKDLKNMSNGDFDTGNAQGEDDNKSHHHLFAIIRKLIPGVELSSDSTFFSIGGDSLMAIELLWSIKLEYPDANFMMSDLQQNTLHELANRMTTSIFTRTDVISSESEMPSEKRPRLERTDSSFRQSYACETFIDININDRHCQYELSTRSADRSLFTNTREVDQERSKSLTMPQDAKMNLAWKVDTGRCVDATPIFVHFEQPLNLKIIYIGSHSGDFFCINADNGTIVWKASLGHNQHIECSAAMHCDGVVFISSYYGADVDGIDTAEVNTAAIEGGNLWAIDAFDGTLLWTSHSPKEMKSSPIVCGNRLWLADYGGKIYVHNIKNNGELEREIDLLSNSAVFASPALTKGKDWIVFASTQGNVAVIDTNTFQKIWIYQLDVPVFATPLWIDNKASQGQEYKEQLVFACVDGSIRSFSHMEGADIYSDKSCEFKPDWKVYNSSRRPIFSSMCILLLNGISCIISGSHDGHIRCLSRDTGKEIWSIDLGSIIFSSPFPIASSNHVVVGTTAGELVVLKCTYETCFPICSTRLDGEIYSSPICVMELVSSKYCNDRRENTVTATHYDHDIYCRIFVGSRDNSVANFNVSSLPTLN